MTNLAAKSFFLLLLRIPQRIVSVSFQYRDLGRHHHWVRKGWMTRSLCVSTVSTDRTGWNNLNPVMFSRPLVICGPSGAGKGTLIKHLLAEHPTRFGFSVSHTSRRARPGEEEGVDYFFTSKERLTEAIEAGGFLEHAMVHGNLYGTSFDAIRRVQESKKICILDIDAQGVRNIKAAEAEKRADGLVPVYIFIAPPSLEELENRLRGRHTENETEIQRRLGNARGELEYGMKEGNFHYIVVNDMVDRAYGDLKRAILRTYAGDGSAAPPLGRSD